jgi:hypothetical protein
LKKLEKVFERLDDEEDFLGAEWVARARCLCAALAADRAASTVA